MKEKLKSVDKSIWAIIIIGIILVVLGYLSYIFYFKDASTFNKNEKLFLDGAKYYYELNSNKLPKENSYNEISLEELYKGLYVDTLYVPSKNRVCDGESFVRVINEDGNYRYVTYLKCGSFSSSVDHTGPVITLNGESVVMLGINSKYEELGVEKIKDKYDGTIDNEKVKISNNIDNTKTGSYTVTYKIYDSNYNLTIVERTVTVADTLNEYVKNNTSNGTYVGKDVNNYLLFSGMLFRIVKTNIDGTVKIISETAVANLDNNEDNYENSNVDNWLNNYYYSNIYDKNYINESSWCIGLISDNCSNLISRNIGLLTTTEYNNSFSDGDTYLYNGSHFLLANKSSSSSSIAYNKTINNEIGNSLLAIRPTINLKQGLYVVSGDGSSENPYRLMDYKAGKEGEKLSNRLVGEFFNYSGYNFVISNIEEDGRIKAIMADVLVYTDEARHIMYSFNENSIYSFDPDNKNSIAYALNNEYLDYINDKYLVKGTFLDFVHQNNLKYTEFSTNERTARIGLPISYEMFSSGLSSNIGANSVYLLGDTNPDDYKVYVINGVNSRGFVFDISDVLSYNLKLAVYMKNDLKISSGNGTYLSPYYLK